MKLLYFHLNLISHLISICFIFRWANKIINKIILILHLNYFNTAMAQALPDNLVSYIYLNIILNYML